MTPPSKKIIQPIRMTRLRECDERQWKLINQILLQIYNYFRNFDEGVISREFVLGVEGSYELFERGFEDGDMALVWRESSGHTFADLWLWSELEEKYQIPESGPVSVCLD